MRLTRLLRAVATKLLNLMKKLLFWLFLLLPVVLLAQTKKPGSIDFLNANPNFGGIVLGDSITHYLTRLEPIEELGNGGFKCEATDRDNFDYRLRGVSPISVFVTVEKHRIKNIYAVYPFGNALDIDAALTERYGNYSAYSEGAYNWYGKDVFVIRGVNGNKTSYVIFSYVRPLE